MRPRLIETDYPCREDVAFEIPESLGDAYYDLCANTDGFKLGGWPSLIQSEIFWGADQLTRPEYVFQIDSDPKASWAWGDSGVGYFGRGTTEAKRDEWSLEWQCY